METSFSSLQPKLQLSAHLQTQSYPPAHLSLSTLNHLLLHLLYLCVSLKLSFFLFVPFHFPTSPSVLSSLKVFFKDSSLQVNHCMSVIVWPKFDSLQSSFAKSEPHIFLSFFLGEMTQGGQCFWQSSRGSDFICCANFGVSFSVLYPSLNLTHISCVVHVFPQDFVDKSCFFFSSPPKNTCLVFYLPIFSCS